MSAPWNVRSASRGCRGRFRPARRPRFGLATWAALRKADRASYLRRDPRGPKSAAQGPRPCTDSYREGTFMQPPVERYMNLVPMVVEQTNRGERAYDIFLASAQGAHHLHYRPGRGRHGDAGLRAASVPRGREPEEGDHALHQFAGRRGHLAAWRSTTPCSSSSRPVSTLCIGQAASMGSLLLTAGDKDMRFATPNARIMVHQPSGGFQGQASDIERHAQDIIKLKRRLNEVYVKHTGQRLRDDREDARPRPLHDRRRSQGFRPHRQGDFVARAGSKVAAA